MSSNDRNDMAAAFPLSPVVGGEGTIATTVGWTVGGVATLFLLGKLIALAGAGMPYGCWQLTGARAAASTLVLGSLITMRRGHLALFGALYALTLLSSHSSPLLLASAVLAGVAAWLIARRGATTLTLLASTLAFNLLLTLSGLVTAMGVDAHARTGIINWSSGAGIRAAATVIVVGCFAIARRK